MLKRELRLPMTLTKTFLYWLLHNSNSGKTMGNIRNHVDVRICTQSKQIERLATKPKFKRSSIFAENLSVVHMAEPVLQWNTTGTLSGKSRIDGLVHVRVHISSNLASALKETEAI